jgi:hypothetical protein
MATFTTAVSPTIGQMVSDGSGGSFDWDVQVRDNLQALYNGLGFAASGTTLSIAGTGAYVKLPFNTEVWDSHAYYDNVTNYRFTPLVAGKYQITLAVYGITLNGSSGVSIHKNGAFNNVQSQGQPVTADSGFCAACIISMNGTTDYVEAFAFHNTGSARNWSGHFGARLVGV